MKETVLEMLEQSGLDDALRCFDRLADKRQRVKLKVALANEVKHLMSETSRFALDVAAMYAKGFATDEELWDAAVAASDASAAYAASDAAAVACANYTAAYSAADDYAVRSEMEAKQVQILKQFLEATE